MPEDSAQLGDGTHHYIGENDCKVASCTDKQEFPDAECPYCIIHSVQKHMTGEAQPDV